MAKTIEQAVDTAKRFFKENDDARDLLDNEQFSELFDVYMKWLENTYKWYLYQYKNDLATVLCLSDVDYEANLSYINDNVLGAIISSDSGLIRSDNRLARLCNFTLTDGCPIKEGIKNYLYIETVRINVRKLDLDDIYIESFIRHINTKNLIIDRDTRIARDGVPVNDTADLEYSTSTLFSGSDLEKVYLPDCIKKISVGTVAPMGQHNLSYVYLSKDVEVPESAKEYLKSICHPR